MADLLVGAPISNPGTATNWWDYSGNPSDPEWVPDNVDPDTYKPGVPGNGQSASDLAKNNWSEDNYIDKMITMANNGNEAAIQWLANYYATKESEKSARDWTSQREDSAYSRMVADLTKAGISPYILSGATPAVSSSSGKSYSGSQLVNDLNNKRTSNTQAVNQVLRLIGVVSSALIMALLAA